MAGILNNKERVMDILVTSEGRRQAAAFTFMPKYASFTDLNTFYQLSGSGVAESASSRIYFEATNRHQDVIVPELEPGAEGGIVGLFRTEDFTFAGKTIASGTIANRRRNDATGELMSRGVLTGSSGVKQSGRFLKGILNNLEQLRTLKTRDDFSTTTGFSIDTTYANFKVKPSTRFPKSVVGTDYNGDGRKDESDFGMVDLDTSPSIYQDRRFSHLPNFQYLPPINVPTNPEDPGEPLGNYARLNEPPVTSFVELMEMLQDRQKIEFGFLETSVDNNLLGQFFEFKNSENSSAAEIEKLSIVDFGTFPDDDPFSPDKHVFFVGKVFSDSIGTDTFINIFTVVFD